MYPFSEAQKRPLRWRRPEALGRTPKQYAVSLLRSTTKRQPRDRLQVAPVPRVGEPGPGHGLDIDADDVTYFLGRETILVTHRRGMAIWREKLFVLMARNAVRATAFFRLPAERVVELGVQVEI